jgi:hypothetical protein
MRAAYRGQGHIGTGCISPGGQLLAIFFAAREAGCAQVFGRRHPRCQPRAPAAGVRKAPRASPQCQSPAGGRDRRLEHGGGSVKLHGGLSLPIRPSRQGLGQPVSVRVATPARSVGGPLKPPAGRRSPLEGRTSARLGLSATLTKKFHCRVRQPRIHRDISHSDQRCCPPRRIGRSLTNEHSAL